MTDIRKSMLVDLIIVSDVISHCSQTADKLFCGILQLCKRHFVVLQAVMGAGSECYSEYTAFHLFEEYLEVRT